MVNRRGSTKRHDEGTPNRGAKRDDRARVCSSVTCRIGPQRPAHGARPQTGNGRRERTRTRRCANRPNTFMLAARKIRGDIVRSVKARGLYAVKLLEREGDITRRQVRFSATGPI